MKRKRSRPRARAGSEADFHHHVYVVLLDSKVADHPSVQRLNPRRDPTKPCLYVGMTGLDPAERFANHKRGYKAAWVVEKYGIRLLPELYACFNPMPFQAAARRWKRDWRKTFVRKGIR